MKRFMKGCAITAFVFAVLGFVLAFVGRRVAGSKEIERAVSDATGGWIRVNTEPWWKLGVYSGVKELLEPEEEAGHSASAEYWEGWEDREGEMEDDGAYHSENFDKEYSILSGNVEKYCPGTDIRKLDIQVGCCQLMTLPSEDGKIYLEAHNARKFQGYVEDGTLYIKSAPGGSVIDWADISDRIINLYLPDDYRFEEVDMEVGAGQLMFTDLRSEEISLEVGAGHIDICGIQTKNLDVSVGAGYMNLDQMDVTEMDVEVGLGEFTAFGRIGREADIECSMGNVELELEGNERDYNYDLENSMGNVNLGNENFSGLSQERYIDNGADKNINIECSMGNITVYFQ